MSSREGDSHCLFDVHALPTGNRDRWASALRLKPSRYAPLRPAGRGTVTYFHDGRQSTWIGPG